MDMHPPSRRRPGARPLADVLGAALSPVLAAKGFANREVIGNWATIVGDRLGLRSRPLKIDWPKRHPGAAGEQTEPATLVVLVESAFAPEMQHAAPVVMARLNAHLGWSAVGRIVLKQGPVAPQSIAARHLVSEPDDAARAAVDQAVAAITGPELRDSVARLGLAISRRSRQRSQGG
ncbi:MAG: DciA family protein [Hyphomicrobiales bacterium]|nr:DciA family protein [Hyphomicrobiales bacterium]